MTSLAAVPVMVVVPVLLMRIEQGAEAHGFRATACTILNELGYRPDIIERQLAHKERNTVRASYNRAEYLHKRRQMMQQWADYLDSFKTDAKIVRLRGVAPA
jgi:integrase